YSTAMGYNTEASGEYSTAMGRITEATGYYSTAMGRGTKASEQNSTAMGYSTIASGISSTAMGHSTKARSYGETAIGLYNTDYTPGSTTNSNSNDRLFVVGNGTSTTLSNALIIYKDGRMNINDAYTLPNSDGGSGDVMTTDGSGNVSWATPILGSDDQNISGSGLTGTTLTIGIEGGGSETVDLSSLSPTGLENITEGTNSGWRFIGANTANYGDIGQFAQDLSMSGDPSTLYGATGNYSFASGRKTEASGLSSVAMGLNSVASGKSSVAMGHSTKARSYGETAIGLYNTDYTPGSTTNSNSNDRLFVVGNGTSTTLSNALIIYKDGRMNINDAYTLPNSDGGSGDVMTTDGSGNATWEALATFTGLEKVTENAKDGWRFVGVDTNNYGGIGQEALDMSYSASPNTVYGATGDYSIAMGYNTTSQNFATLAIGFQTVASGNTSVALGAYSVASGDVSTAIGYEAEATGNTSTAIGGYVIASGEVATAMGFESEANGDYSTALGYYTHSDGNYSTAMGYEAKASSNASTAMGFYTTAESLSETAIGMYNTLAAAPDASSWVGGDRIFVIGNGTATGSESDAMVVLKSGNTGIGTSTPTAKLQVNTTLAGQSLLVSHRSGVGNGLHLNNNLDGDTWEIYTWSSNDLNFRFNGANTATIDDVTGTYNAISDKRLKQNIKPLDSVLYKVDKLDILQYSFIHDEEHSNQIGVLAQDAHKLFPEFVTPGETNEEGQNTWMVNYAGFSMVAIKAIQEQQEIIEKQKQQIINHQNDMKALKAEVESIKSLLQSSNSSKNRK
ncbi:tail fiber domain-containing protein, partial [Aureispira]|nr:tail fiber domain-containing protein [Aureispira sp.]